MADSRARQMMRGDRIGRDVFYYRLSTRNRTQHGSVICAYLGV